MKDNWRSGGRKCLPGAPEWGRMRTPLRHRYMTRWGARCVWGTCPFRYSLWLNFTIDLTEARFFAPNDPQVDLRYALDGR